MRLTGTLLAASILGSSPVIATTTTLSPSNNTTQTKVYSLLHDGKTGIIGPEGENVNLSEEGYDCKILQTSQGERLIIYVKKQTHLLTYGDSDFEGDIESPTQDGIKEVGEIENVEVFDIPSDVLGKILSSPDCKAQERISTENFLTN